MIRKLDSKKIYILPVLVTSIVLIVSLFYYKNSTFGQTKSTGYNIELSPAKKNISINPGDNYIQKFTIGNYSGSSQTLHLFVQDFTVKSEEGTPEIYDITPEEGRKFALSQWMVLPTDTVTIPNDERVEVEVQINVPADAEPGGHYGAFIVQTQAPSQEGTAVGAIGRLASLMLVNIPGDTAEEVTIAKAFTDKPIYWDENPTVHFVTFLKNKGNVHGIPTGAFNISGGYGHKSKSVIYNQNQSAVLPGAPERKLVTEFSMKKGEGIVPPIGKFTIDLVARYGTANLPLETTIFFWMLPVKFIAIALLGTVITLFVAWRALLSFKK